MTSTADLQIFHNDLRAAVRAGVELEIGDQPMPGSNLSIKQLEKLEANVEKNEAVPSRYQAAIETWQTTGSMVPVLEGLSTRKKAWKQIGKLFRRAMCYILLIAVVAIAVLVHYKTCVLPEIEAVRQELSTLAIPGQEISESHAVFLSTAILVLFIVMFVGLICWMLGGGVAKAGWWIGGGAYMRCQALAVAARTTQLLVAEGVEPARATELGSSLAGLDAEGQGELLYTVQDLNQNDLQSPAMADYLLMIADRQYVATRTWGPGLLIVVLGGVFTVMFALLAYAPFVSLLGDLSKIMKI